MDGSLLDRRQVASFEKIAGFGLTTAHILYRLPDHPAVLQSYVWQQYDLFPRFPELKRFLDFWERELEGPLHSVEVAHHRLTEPTSWRGVTMLQLH